jgi:3-oxoadipate enol-lactonase
MEANGISIHFELAGQGPSVVLLHEMGGTLDSWDGIVPALNQHFRTLRYD